MNELKEGQRFKANYRYQAKAIVQFESRKSYIKNLRAMALFVEENITDHEFDEIAHGKKPFPQLDTYKMKELEALDGPSDIHRYEISMIPNYGNDEIIIETVRKMGIENTGKTRPGGFFGIDVPVILDIECSEDKKDELERILNKKATDSFDIYERCFACGLILDK